MARSKDRHDHFTTDMSRDVQGRPQIEGAPGTLRGRAGTAGTEGQSVARRDRSPENPEGGAGDRDLFATGSGMQGFAAQENAPERKVDSRTGSRQASSGSSRSSGSRDAAEEEAEARLRQPTPDRVRAEDENDGVGLSGSDDDLSGSLPGSIGGTTGTSGHNFGIQSPGADDPAFPGQSYDEAEELRRKGREKRGG